MSPCASPCASEALLAPGELLRLETAQGVEVSVESGLVWITEESRTEDIWLAAGQCARLQGRGLALVEAIAGTHVHIATC